MPWLCLNYNIIASLSSTKNYSRQSFKQILSTIKQGVDKLLRSALRNPHGYTFVELLIAITILGIVIAPFLALFSSSYLSILTAGKQTTAVNLCREQMETVKALDYSTVYDYYVHENRSPKIEKALPGYPGFRRTTVVKPFTFYLESDPSYELELLFIAVTVSWPVQNSERSLSLESYLAER